ncbi:MAG: sugar ABC transporter ATP-binding protein [Planctomycetota bacterium]|nr:sugar ABC transporter ATP-binding protein [Planctomycetota bacterium]
MDPRPDLLVAEHISKRFGITQALDDVTVRFAHGEVHALMGENGAGKSTLGRIIAGLTVPDAGRVAIDGHALRPGSFADAFHAGVRIVHQELAQCPNLSVAENLSLHDVPRTRLGLVDFRAMADRAAAMVHQLDPGIDVEAPLGLLSPGRRQICQIAAALDERSAASSGPRAIVFDEPTSSLSIAEADRLLEVIRALARRGLAIIYVSHRMGEIFAVCDRVTVLRDGRYVATTPVRGLDEPTLVEQMIGRRLATPVRAHRAPTAAPHAAPGAVEAAAVRALAGEPPRTEPGPGAVPGPAPRDRPGRPLLEVRDLNSPGKLRDVSLGASAGEVLGIGGLVGSGRSELLDAIFGLDPGATGTVLVDAVPVPPRAPRAAIGAGLGYVPEDRRRQGLFFDLSIHENLVMPFMRRLAAPLGVRGLGAERRLVREKLAEFQIKAASPVLSPATLSGGNQQKVLIARWMGAGTRVLLLDEPTRGIDVGTKAEIYRLVRAASDAGAAVVLVSSEMPELLALSDRILVMCDGRIAGELTADAITQANILRLATVSSAPGTPAPPAARASAAAR